MQPEVRNGHGPAPHQSRPRSYGEIEIRVDQTFRMPPNERDLGMVLLGVGFK
jgi:hypothetical protein